MLIYVLIFNKFIFDATMLHSSVFMFHVFREVLFFFLFKKNVLFGTYLLIFVHLLIYFRSASDIK